MAAGVRPFESANVVTIPGFDELPAASSFMSSRWSRDNLITSHPARLYDGTLLERIDLESLERLVQGLVAAKGPLELGAARMGVFTWNIACEGARGPFVLQVPLALDEPGRRQRSKREVPRQNFENMSHFRQRGLRRFVLEPLELLALGDSVPVALFEALPSHHPITFSRGSARIEVAQGAACWFATLGAAASADLLSEMIAALVYHYDPDLDGGTALTDVSVNDGDFAVARRADGSFDVRLTAARRREPHISSNLLLLYLIQMMGYEDWNVDGALVGLPVLLGNPSVAFEGVTRGLRYRYGDLGQDNHAAQAQAQADAWITAFGRSREGRSYRPWVERYLRRELPPRFGADLRERWWRLMPLQTRLGRLELSALNKPGADTWASVRAVSGLIERLAREIGREPEEAPSLARVNDLDRDRLVELLSEAGIPAAEHATIASELFRNWPFRSLDQLVARVPGARRLRRSKSKISFGEVVMEADHGTLKALGSATESDSARPIANHELFGALRVPAEQEAAAARVFPSFEAYMDAALHDERWGYYAQSVEIGRAGHFDTHPESLTPHYGRWLSLWLFRAWEDLLAHGELGESDPFSVIEFGAGNGRLARDILDAIADNTRRPGSNRERWRLLQSRIAYRIYEKSESLRGKQAQLLKGAATVMSGDARCPAATLARDFASGLRGVVLTNEVPDAFGVHKLLFTADGRALVALVVPRMEQELRRELPLALQLRIDALDPELRQRFALQRNPADVYLDAASYAEVMHVISTAPATERAPLLERLWFEEAYVSAARFPELAAHLGANSEQYATALAAQDSGVVTYVNLHAERFIRELGGALNAGFVITIDYGDTTWGMIQGARRGDFPFRVYGQWEDYVPRPNDPYAAPGTQDLTADVNFTTLASAGAAAGLKVVHFGLERDVASDELPQALAAAEAQEPFAKFLGNPVFKVLIQGTRSSDAFASRLQSRLPLIVSERDVAKSRRGRIESIARTLRGLS